MTRPRHVTTGAACSATIYALVALAVLASIVGIVLTWSAMVEKKLPAAPDEPPAMFRKS